MGFNLTKPIEVDGMINALALFTTEGYSGPAILGTEGTIYNADPAVALYLHFTDSNAVEPDEGADGLPVGGADAPSSSYTLPKGTDLSTTWFSSESAIDVNFGVQG
jgi:hypothetical protein